MKYLFYTVFLILAYINYRYLNIGFLSTYSVDEYAFHGSLLNMYHGVMDLNIKELFSFKFYSYGFIFFLINLIGTFPFFLFHQTELTIYIPRLITSIFAVGSLYVIYLTAKQYLNKTYSLFIVILLLCMPGFWKNGFWFHPDWMMTFFLCLSVYFLQKDQWSYGRDFWKANIFVGIAMAVKVQAITFYPFVGLYIYYDLIFSRDTRGFLNQSVLLLKAVAIHLFIFFMLNPYLLHPAGLKAFTASFIENMASNATNHGRVGTISLIDKLANPVDFYYLNPVLFFSLVAVSGYLIIKQFSSQARKSMLPMVAFFFLTNILYLFLLVNKDWNHYYLPVMTIGVLLFIPFLQLRKISRPIIPFIILAIQVVFHIPAYGEVFKNITPAQQKQSRVECQKMSDTLIHDLWPVVNENTGILMESNIPFDFGQLSLSYNNIKIIYGPLRPELISSKDYLKQHPHKKSEDFKPVDIIVLSKTGIYYDQERLSSRVDTVAYEYSVRMIDDFNAGKKWGYTRYKENPYFYIWKRKKLNPDFQ
jgi:hypothetical protein